MTTKQSPMKPSLITLEANVKTLGREQDFVSWKALTMVLCLLPHRWQSSEGKAF